MTLGWKVVIDSTDPHAKAAFWAAALGYVVEDNRVLLERPLSAGAIPQETVITAGGRPAFRTLQAVRHPNMWSWRPRRQRVLRPVARWCATISRAPQGPDTPLAPSTMFTLLLWSAPATALTWYSPGRTRVPALPQPVLRSQETCSVAGVPLARTAGAEPEPLAQSAEFQMSRPRGVSITTDTARALMSKWQGWLAVETARTVNRGVTPG